MRTTILSLALFVCMSAAAQDQPQRRVHKLGRYDVLATNPAPKKSLPQVELPFTIDGKETLGVIDTTTIEKLGEAYRLSLDGSKGDLYYVPGHHALYMKDFTFTTTGTNSFCVNTSEDRLPVTVEGENSITTRGYVFESRGEFAIEGIGGSTAADRRLTVGKLSKGFLSTGSMMLYHMTITMEVPQTLGLQSRNGESILTIEGINGVFASGGHACISGFKKVSVSGCGLTEPYLNRKITYDTARKELKESPRASYVNCKKIELSTESTAWPGAESEAKSEVKAETDAKEEAKTDVKANDKVYDVVEQMPSFPGGNEAMKKWLSENIKYPAIAQEQGVQGHVHVGFIVEPDGSLTDVKVLRAPDDSLGKEAVRLVKAMPAWEPGYTGGRAVRTRCITTVSFKLVNR